MDLKLYVAICDYFATGEGTSTWILIGYAQDEQEMRKKWENKFFTDTSFSKEQNIKFAEYFGIGLHFYEDAENMPDYCTHLIPKYILDSIKRDKESGYGFPGEYYSYLHVNYG